MDRFEQGAPATLSLTLKVNGVLTDADGTPTVTVYDGAGAEVATGDAAHPSTGFYQFQIEAADLTTLEVFRAEWSYVQAELAQTKIRHFRTVGSFYVTLDELREFGDGTLSDTDEYPDQKLVNYREQAEEMFERETGVSFVPLGRRVVLSGHGRDFLTLPSRYVRRLVAGAVDTVVLSSGQLAAVTPRSRGLYWGDLWPRGVDNLSLHYEYGWDEPPEEIREAVKHYVRRRILPVNSIDETALTITHELGTQQLAQPDADHPTGIPYVDAVIARYKETDDVGTVTIGSSF